MNLKDYLAGLERGGAATLASQLEIAPSYLSQMAAGSSPVSPARCVAVEKVTSGAVSRWDLRPDDWDLIWPELVGAKGAPRPSRKGRARRALPPHSTSP